MKSRTASAITVIVCVMALAVEGFAIALPDADEKQSAFTDRMDGYYEQAEIPLGPCGWFAPENCVKSPPLEGCTAERRDEIDERSASYRYEDFLGEPSSDYVEIDSGCKRDFAGGTIYVTYPGRQSKLLTGPIRDFYLLLGETSSDLGWPQSSEPLRVDASERLSVSVLEAVASGTSAPEHRFQFADGWVYWHPDYLNPLIVMDRVHDLFRDEGGTPELGFPSNSTGVDSHEGSVLYQAFDSALIFENALGELEIFRDEMLDAYLEAASESRDGDPVDGPLDAETELGLPTSDYLPTPNGSVRLLHRGTIYYSGREALQVFPAFVAMLDGVVVHWEEDAASDFTPDEMVLAIERDPYLADYRKDVLFEAFGHEGLCGDAARESVGTRSDEYCSEFVREVYIAAGVDSGLCGRRACLWAVTWAPQLRRIFQGNGRWVYARDAGPLTPEPGDYISMWDQGHSALVVAPSIDGRHLWRIGGNEGDDQCVVFSRSSFFDDAGVINPDFYGFGRLQPSFFD